MSSQIWFLQFLITARAFDIEFISIYLFLLFYIKWGKQLNIFLGTEIFIFFIYPRLTIPFIIISFDKGSVELLFSSLLHSHTLLCGNIAAMLAPLAWHSPCFDFPVFQWCPKRTEFPPTISVGWINTRRTPLTRYTILFIFPCTHLTLILTLLTMSMATF